MIPWLSIAYQIDILQVFVPPVKRPNLPDLQKGEYESHKHENSKLVKYCSQWHDSK